MYRRALKRSAIVAAVWVTAVYSVAVLRDPNHPEVVAMFGGVGLAFWWGFVFLLLILMVSVPLGAAFGVLLVGFVRGLVSLGVPRGRLQRLSCLQYGDQFAALHEAQRRIPMYTHDRGAP